MQSAKKFKQKFFYSHLIINNIIYIVIHNCSYDFNNDRLINPCEFNSVQYISMQVYRFLHNN
jgi:hypothetical protein